MDIYTFELVNFPFLTRADSVTSDDKRQDVNLYSDLIVLAVQYVGMIEKDGDLAELMGSLRNSLLKGGRMMLPILNLNQVEDFRARLQSAFQDAAPATQVDLTIALVAALIAEAKYSAFGVKLWETRFGMAVQTEIASYESWKTAMTRFSGFENAASSLLRDHEEQFSKFNADAARALQAASTDVIDLQSRASEAVKRMTEAELGFSSILQDHLTSIEEARAHSDQTVEASKRAAELSSTAEGNIASFKAAVLEATKIDTARKLWDRRANNNAIAFWSSALVIGVFLIVIPIAAFVHLDQVLDTLGHIMQTTLVGFDAANLGPAALTALAINRIVIVTVPIALYFWIVRLLIRYNTRAQMLLDDARQRHTMLDTYFHLIEKDGATKADRALVLNALFRPAPGQQSEAVEPPNFTELLEKAMSKG